MKILIHKNWMPSEKEYSQIKDKLLHLLVKYHTNASPGDLFDCTEISEDLFELGMLIFPPW